MDEQQSQEIAQEIETKRQQLRQATQTLSSSSNCQHPLLQEKFPPIFEKEQEPTPLYKQYERQTGEPYDDDGKEDKSAAVIYVPQQQDDKEKLKRLSWNGTISGQKKATSFLMTGKVHSFINTVFLIAVE
jgi:hypothetical protein